MNLFDLPLEIQDKIYEDLNYQDLLNINIVNGSNIISSDMLLSSYLSHVMDITFYHDGIIEANYNMDYDRENLEQNKIALSSMLFRLRGYLVNDINFKIEVHLLLSVLNIKISKIYEVIDEETSIEESTFLSFLNIYFETVDKELYNYKPITAILQGFMYNKKKGFWCNVCEKSFNQYKNDGSTFYKHEEKYDHYRAVLKVLDSWSGAEKTYCSNFIWQNTIKHCILNRDIF